MSAFMKATIIASQKAATHGCIHLQLASRMHALSTQTGFLGLLSGDTMSAFITAAIMASQKAGTSASCTPCTSRLLSSCSGDAGPAPSSAKL